MADAIRIRGLRKSFRQGFIPKTRTALRGVDVTVGEGEIFGYLGPNGAGKTTTIKCLLGLVFPDAGTIEIFGRPHRDPRSRAAVGFLPELPYFYDYLTADELLRFAAALFGIGRDEAARRSAALLKRVGLDKASGVALRKFSRGMLQRVGLAQALVNDPRLVVLDEPLGGLDPLGRKDLRDIIAGLKDEGRTVFLSSHILQDIEMVCDRVAILAGGRVASQGALRDLVSERVLFTEVTVAGAPASAFAGLGEAVTARGDQLLLKVADESRVPLVLDAARRAGGRVVSLVPRTETLEDIFVETVRPA